VLALGAEEVEDCFFHHIFSDFADGFGERNIFWANFDAILRVAAFLDSAVAHQCIETLVL